MKKTVLITGGTSDLGISISEVFAMNNYDILFTYHKKYQEAKLLETHLKEKYNISAKGIEVDLCKEKDIKSLFSNIKNLDCLINNAAYNNDLDIHMKTKEDFMHTLEVNLVGPFLMSKYAYPFLKENNGNIINITSTNGIDTMYPESIDYDASKAGLNNLTKNLATAYAPEVRVNAIAPGWIDTSNTRDMSDEFRKQELDKILMNRFANPKEIAELVYFIASENASYITGTIFRIDGGMKR